MELQVAITTSSNSVLLLIVVYYLHMVASMQTVPLMIYYIAFKMSVSCTSWQLE